MTEEQEGAWFDAAGYDDAYLGEICPVGVAIEQSNAGEKIRHEGNVKFHRIGKNRGILCGVVPEDPTIAGGWMLKFHPVDLDLSQPYSGLAAALAGGLGCYFYFGDRSGRYFPIEAQPFRRPRHAQVIGTALFDLWNYEVDGALALVEALLEQYGEWDIDGRYQSSTSVSLLDVVYGAARIRLGRLDSGHPDYVGRSNELLELAKTRQARREKTS